MYENELSKIQRLLEEKKLKEQEILEELEDLSLDKQDQEN